jgi:hypothetical protein
MTAKTISIKIAEGDLATIDADAGPGGRSAYLIAAALDRVRVWRQALSTLRALGWRREHILAAMSGLQGVFLGPYAPGIVEIELRDLALADEAPDVDGWLDRIDEAGRSVHVEHALYVLAGVYHRSAGLRAAIDAIA